MSTLPAQLSLELRALLLGSAAGSCVATAIGAGLDGHPGLLAAALVTAALLALAMRRPLPWAAPWPCLALIFLSALLESLEGGGGHQGFAEVLLVLGAALLFGVPGAAGAVASVGALSLLSPWLLARGFGGAAQPRGLLAAALAPTGGFAVAASAGVWARRRFGVLAATHAGQQREEERTAALLETEVKLRTHAQNELARAYQGALDGARVKTAFLANMSHELRTPMNAVLGLTDLVLRDPLTDAQRENLETVRESSQGLLVLLDDLLDLSKIDAGAMRLDAIDFSPREVLAQLERLLGQRAAAKGLRLETQVDAEVPAMLLGDPLRLTQVLTNLAGNSLKFTELGKVEVRLGWSGAVLSITVTDSGIGMTEAQRAALFQPFSQADVSTTRRFGGTGLGLAIVKRLCELHGGDVRVDSEYGVGSVFTARLCYQLGQSGVSRARGGSGVRPVQPLDGVRVLVAEDNRINQRVAQRLLERLGVSCRIVNNGLEAVADAAKGGWQVILMDIQMPELDGIEATRQIRALPMDQPVIIALSANAMEEDKAAARAAGIDDFLAKPITLDTLADALRRGLRGQPPGPVATAGS